MADGTSETQPSRKPPFDERPRFKQPSDEVFRIAAVGDPDAVARISETYHYLIVWTALRLNVPGWDIDDMVQTGHVCLLEILQQYDPRKAKFSTYLTKVVSQRLLDAARRDGIIRTPTLDDNLKSRRSKRARELARYVTSLDEPLNDDGATRHEFVATHRLGPVGEALANEDHERAIAEIERQLDGLRRIPDLRQRDIVLRRMYGTTFRDLAKIYDVSAARVQQLHARAVKHLHLYHLELGDLPVDWRPDEDVARLRLGITDGLDMSLVESCKRFVVVWTYWLKNRMAPFDVEGAIQSGMVAVIEAVRDGEIDVRGVMSIGAKRRIRRHIMNAIRATMVSSKASRPPIADFGYEDGRTLREYDLKPPKDKYARYRRRNIKAGLCPRCGHRPEKFKLCDRCRGKKRESDHRRRLTAKEQPSRPLVSTERDKTAMAMMR